MNSIGKLITFEGGDGVGKSTQAKLLVQKLSDLGKKVKFTREPGGEKIGEEIRQILKNSQNIDPVCETLLLFAGRRDHFIKLISPWINQGYFVICDRFYDSSLVYQGILKEVPINDIMKLKQIAVGDFEPDFTILLDASIDVSMQRMFARKITNDDEYDKMDRQKHELIRKGYQKIAEIFSFRYAVINAEKSEKTVFAKVWKALENTIIDGD
ncbi:MAG: dTMP kinase [Holosporaceae bacterium]|jgi:dTMP kinase|nr:dTMP kinase [Holosporaceae bacterium]